jgi:hypothetical protein
MRKDALHDGSEKIKAKQNRTEGPSRGLAGVLLRSHRRKTPNHGLARRQRFTVRSQRSITDIFTHLFGCPVQE